MTSGSTAGAACPCSLCSYKPERPAPKEPVYRLLLPVPYGIRMTKPHLKLLVAA